MKRFSTLLGAITLCIALHAQSLVPAPFAFSSCGFAMSPTGWTSCTGTPDCAASRCTVPGGCSGQAVMCFGESFSYTLASPLVVGQSYTVSMNVCTGILGGQSIISGNHSFMVVGLVNPPTNCGATNYGSACSTPSSTTLLSGTMNTVGWQNFTNTFTATAALRYLVIGNCDGTGNGGNLFCNFTLINTTILPVEINEFSADANGCEVAATWKVGADAEYLSHFEVYRSSEGMDGVVGQVKAMRGLTEYEFVDPMPASDADYQVRAVYLDGSQSQSEVRRVQVQCDDFKATVEGNPVRGNMATLRFHVTDAEATEIVVTDIGGRIVLQERVENQGEAWLRHPIDVSALQSGTYFVRIGGGTVLKMQLMH